MRCGWLFLALLVLGCSSQRAEREAATLTGGDPSRGKVELRQKGCGSCHTIPGVDGAHALVGPPLDHVAGRSYVAGMLPNTPDNMRSFIMHPQQVKPRNAMPEIGLTDEEARNMTAYLYTLR
jgi:cytochrome c